MRDRVDGVRRDSVAKHDGLGPHAKIPRLQQLSQLASPKLGSAPLPHSSGIAL